MYWIVAAALACFGPSAKAQPPDPPVTSTFTAGDLGPALASPAAAELRLGSLFDGRRRDYSNTTDPLGGIGFTADIRNQQFHKFTLTLPDSTMIEVGQLGIVAPNPLLQTSPYVNLRRNFETYGGPLDGSLKLQAGVVNLGARLFYSTDPSADAQIDASATQLGSVANYFGLTPQKFGGIVSQANGNSVFNPPPINPTAWLQQQLSVDQSFQTQPIFVGSALGQIGKTFRLIGPLDVGLVTGMLLHWEGLFPNVVLDESAALRYHGGGISTAFIGGVSQGVALQTSSFWSNTISSGSTDFPLHPDVAPHFGPEIWGKIPGTDKSYFDAGASWTMNPLTTRSEGHASVSVPTAAGDLTVGGKYEDDSGPAIEYDWRHAGAQVGLRPRGWGIELYAGYANEGMTFGNAGFNNNTALFGIRGGDFSPGHAERSIGVEEQLGGKDQFKLPPNEQLLVLEQMHHYAVVANAFWQAHGAQLDAGWTKLQQEWGSLPPYLRQVIDQTAQKYAPGVPTPGQIIGYPVQKVPVETIAQLAAALTQQNVYEQVLIRLTEHQVLEYLQSVKVPVLGHVDFTAPMVLAAAHVYSMGFTPPIPLTTSDNRNSLNPFLLQELEQYSGQCGGQTSAQGYTNCLLGQSPVAAAQLQKQFGAATGAYLQQAIQWHSDMIQYEVNQAMLQVIVAAEQLDEMTIDHGTKIGDLNTQWLVDDFNRRDRPRNPQEDARIVAAIAQAKRDLEDQVKADKQALKDKLAAAGQQRLTMLQQAAAASGVRFEMPGADWPALLTWYGDDLLMRSLQEMIARMSPGQSLRVEYNPMNSLGVMMIKEANGYTIKLPAPTNGATPDYLLDIAIRGIPETVAPAAPPKLPVGLGPW